MSDMLISDVPDALPTAAIRPQRRGWHVSMIWLLPLIAALLGGWLVYRDYVIRGPLITVRFANAEGIAPHKTRVKYRDVDVGLVEAVHFSDDLTHVLVSARLDPEFRGRITHSTRFWVVRPRIEGLRISGLETLISGAYLTLDLGRGGTVQDTFDSLEEPRSIFSDTPGTFFTLKAPGLGSLSIGSPVYFREIPVGEVVKYRLAADYRRVEIDLFIHAPHDAQVRENSRFWNVSGVELDMSTRGLRVGLHSLAALFAGGIAFESPLSSEMQAPATPGATFTLYASREASKEGPITISQPYVLNFEDSIRGLEVGAPVEFRGLRLGTVTQLGLQTSSKSLRLHTPVTIAIEPERAPLENLYRGHVNADDPQAQLRELIQGWVMAGLRARLQTGNLLTGQLFVELEFIPDTPAATVDHSVALPELPTAPGVLGSVTRSASSLLAKLERLPLTQIGQHLEQTLAGADRLVNRAELGQAINHLETALGHFNHALDLLDNRAKPLLDSLSGASQDLRGLLTASAGTVKQADTTLISIEHALSDHGPWGREWTKMLVELSAASRAMRLLAEYLERHPEALLHGKAR